MGRETGTNDIHALYGAGSVESRQDLFIATNVEVKTVSHSSYFQITWKMWRENAHHYPSRVMWWCRLVKRRIRLPFSRAGVERCRERQVMEHFYSSAMCDVLQNERNSGEMDFR